MPIITAEALKAGDRIVRTGLSDLTVDQVKVTRCGDRFDLVTVNGRGAYDTPRVLAYGSEQKVVVR